MLTLIRKLCLLSIQIIFKNSFKSSSYLGYADNPVVLHKECSQLTLNTPQHFPPLSHQNQQVQHKYRCCFNQNILVGPKTAASTKSFPLNGLICPAIWFHRKVQEKPLCTRGNGLMNYLIYTGKCFHSQLEQQIPPPFFFSFSALNLMSLMSLVTQHVLLFICLSIYLFINLLVALLYLSLPCSKLGLKPTTTINCG